MGIFYNRSSMTIRRRQLRNSMPRAEIFLWARLKNKQIMGYKFRRQHSLGYYVLDFYCPKLKLAIEVDGDSHFTEEAKKYDLRRENYIKSFGIRFLRVTNLDVYNNMDGIIEEIMETIKKLSREWKTFYNK